MPDRDVETRLQRRDFARRLRRLADRVEQGEPFRIQVGGQRLRVPAELELSIEHESESGVQELEFQLRWSSHGSA